MKIDVRIRDLGEHARALHDHAVRGIHFQLGRFKGEVAAITVRLSDVNGPRGGVDKRCLVALRGPRVGVISLDERSGDARTALSNALERAARTTRRALDRLRTVERHTVAEAG